MRQFGCSEKLYRDVFDPLIRVGLFAPSEQCSSAAFLGTLYYFVLANQVHSKTSTRFFLVDESVYIYILSWLSTEKFRPGVVSWDSERHDISAMDGITQEPRLQVSRGKKSDRPRLE